ncbi:MAG: enoyl-CoA hydratase/isomerase family protein [Pseudomonadales bacterium]
MSNIQWQINAGIGLITLDRPKALNALSLDMVRDLHSLLTDWQGNPEIEAVAIRGSNKMGPFGAFCAGGDIRFFHEAAITNDPALEDFFTEEYSLNHLIFTYPKPYIAFMDGIVMGGGMGISQGASLRIITERSKLAMPETNIGLFPDVGGGYFLGRCPGASGEYLALTGQLMLGAEAITVDLADAVVDSTDMPALWDSLTSDPELTVSERIEALHDTLETSAEIASPEWLHPSIDSIFALETIKDIAAALENDGSDWAAQTLDVLHKRSPLMLHVVLKQIRTGRTLSLDDDLRMERDLVHHCFHTDHLGRSGHSSETVEGIRALAIDKDHNPAWKPAHIEDVTPDMVEPFFASPWTGMTHPLALLK